MRIEVLVYVKLIHVPNIIGILHVENNDINKMAGILQRTFSNIFHRMELTVCIFDLGNKIHNWISLYVISSLIGWAHSQNDPCT